MIMVSRCPHCQSAISVSRMSGDYVHTCNSGQTALDQEDITIKGRFTDYTGSGGVPSVESLNMADDLMGTEAEQHGAHFRGVTERGNPLQISRQRQYLHYIPNPELQR